MENNGTRAPFDVESAVALALAPLSQPTEIAMANRDRVQAAARKAAGKAGRYGNFDYAWKLVEAARAELVAGGLMNSRDRLNLAKIRLGLRNVVRRLRGLPEQQPRGALATFMSAQPFVPQVRR